VGRQQLFGKLRLPHRACMVDICRCGIDNRHADVDYSRISGNQGGDGESGEGDKERITE